MSVLFRSYFAISLIVGPGNIGCQRNEKAIDVAPATGGANQGSNSANNGSSFSAGTNSTLSSDPYGAGTGSSSNLQNGLLSQTSSQTGAANGSGLGPNDIRPPSQGAMMALQVLPQLLGCLQQQCNPMGMFQSLLEPMLGNLGGAGGQAGAALGGLFSQATSLLQQGGLGAGALTDDGTNGSVDGY